jgi:hypothetical protein
MKFWSEPHRPQALSGTFAPLADGQDYPGYGRCKKRLRADAERSCKLPLRVDPFVKALQARQGAIWKYGVHEPQRVGRHPRKSPQHNHSDRRRRREEPNCNQ